MSVISGLDLLEKNYQIEKLIARGGMGEVYLAIDKRLDRKVAIKILKVSNVENISELDVSEFIKRFQHEAKAIAKLSHQNIVTIHDFGDENSKYYMVMEYLDGKNLSNILKESNNFLSLEFVIDVAIQICKALEYAHENDVVHRDIKPDNIMLCQKGILKLTDFGIAKHNNKDNFNLTKAGQLLGSIVYSSPEQIQGSLKIDHRSDIYSLGITLYQLLTGRLPFEEENIGDLFLSILMKTPEKPSFYSNKIPANLDNIILKAISKKPDDRFNSALEMRLALEMLLTKDSNLFYNFENTTILEQNSFEPITNQEKSIIQTIVSKTSIINKTKLNNSFIKTKTSINNSMLSNINPNIKDFIWVSNITEDWKIEKFIDIDSKKIFKNIVKNTNFTGVVIVNKEYYVFSYNGYLIGAFNIYNNQVGNEVVLNIPDISDIVELRSPKEQNSLLPVLISNILNLSIDNVFHSENESVSKIRELVLNLLDSDDKFSGVISLSSKDDLSEILYFAYDEGNLKFSISSKDLNLGNKSINIMDYLITQTKKINLDIYKCHFTLLEYSFSDMLSSVVATISYKNKSRSNLNFILELGKGEELSKDLIDIVKENLLIELKVSDDFRIDNKKIYFNIQDFIDSHICSRFINWFFNNYFYIIDSSLNRESLGLIFNHIPKVESISFFSFKNKNNYTYPILMKDRDNNIVFLVTYGDCSVESLKKFLSNVIEDKKIHKSLQSVFYISLNSIPLESQEFFKELTKGSILKLFDKNSKYKGLVKTQDKEIFQLNLIEYNSKILDFNSILPSLF